MRFLLDQNQSPELVEHLRSAGHDAIHVRSLGMSRASDNEIMVLADAEERILVSGDTDFGDLLASTNAASPSVLLLRRQEGRRAASIAALLLANLDTIGADLDAGAIVVIDEHRIRVRRLPISPT